MKKNQRMMIASCFVLLIGILLFYNGTDGFQAFTSEAARVTQLTKEKPQFPNVTFEDSERRSYSISEFEDKYVLITFFYTSCTSVCYILEHNMAQVYERLPARYLGENIVFLSISFDPTKDDPATLDKYKDYFKSDGETWRMARIPEQSQLDALLEEFGVIVIPDDNGNYAHNSAFYLVDGKGQLVDVMDFTKVEEAADTITSILEKEKRG